jgi:hypothetical protein
VPEITEAAPGAVLVAITDPPDPLFESVQHLPSNWRFVRQAWMIEVFSGSCRIPSRSMTARDRRLPTDVNETTSGNASSVNPCAIASFAASVA